MNLRNLEDIQENDARSGGFPLGTLFLAAIAGGALVVVVMMGLERKAAPTQNPGDPLEQLVQSARKNPPPSAMTVGERQVTFPQILSDRSAPTTALAVVKDERGRLRESDATLSSDLSEPEVPPPTPNDKLPTRVLPVGDLLSRTPVTAAPKDDLTQIANQQTANSDNGEMAPMGFEGGFEIQVASFRESTDAEAFVTELRKRGHRAYRQAAYVPERGLWHRVRVGPFKSRYEAQRYQQKLEAAERISTFLVDPDKVKRQQEIREAKEKARDAKAQRAKKRLESAQLSSKP